MDDELFEGQVVVASRLAPIDVVISTLAAVSGWLDDIVDLLCRHANWKVSRRTMHQEAAQEIERLVSE